MRRGIYSWVNPGGYPERGRASQGRRALRSRSSNAKLRHLPDQADEGESGHIEGLPGIGFEPEEGESSGEQHAVAVWLEPQLPDVLPESLDDVAVFRPVTGMKDDLKRLFPRRCPPDTESLARYRWGDAGNRSRQGDPTLTRPPRCCFLREQSEGCPASGDEPLGGAFGGSRPHRSRGATANHSNWRDAMHRVQKVFPVASLAAEPEGDDGLVIRACGRRKCVQAENGFPQHGREAPYLVQVASRRVRSDTR